MFKLKGKTIWLFTLIVLGLAIVGAYFYSSLTSLNKRVEESVYPQKRSNYLRNITLNVNKLSNLYLVDSITFSKERVDTLLIDIERDLDSLKVELDASTDINSRMLDTIPALLRNVEEEYVALSKVKESSQLQFNADLERLLIDELTSLNLRGKDSVTIVKQITSEIYDRVENQDKNSNRTAREKGQRNSRSFFQRLFGSSADDEASSESEVAPSVSKDTIVSTSIDTLQSNTFEKAGPALQLISVLDEVHHKRIRALERLKARETEIFQKNIEVNNYIENILNVILFEELNAFNKSIEDFNEKSKSYLWRTGFIILVILSLGAFSIYVIIKDINKSIFYQEKLKASESKALREAEEKQKFLSTMSHEIRNPLTSIIGYAELLNEEDEHVKAIKTASNYLYHMTNEILDVAKIKAGIITIKEEPFNLNHIFEQLQNSFEPLIEKQKITPIFETPPAPSYVYSDKYRIQQTLYNLIHNAVKFTEEGFIKVGFRTKAKDQNKIEVQFFVEDSGVGMNPEEQKTIFEDFQQAGTHKNKMKGTGLGMGIVKSLVQKLGGEIELKSEQNVGSEFRITFLFKQANAHDLCENDTIEELSENALEGYSIFVLDDDPLITRLYKNTFTKYGANVTALNEPKAALEHLVEHQYNLAIFDMKMPGMSGSELLDLLIQKGKKPKKIAVCTANVLLSEEDELGFKKFDYQLFKPLMKQDLIRLVNRVFNLEPIHVSVEKNLSIRTDSIVPARENFDFSLDGLKAYTDTETELMEMLTFLVEENGKSLDALEKAIAIENPHEMANCIHKLCSRFTQLQITAPKNSKEIELICWDGDLTRISEVKELYEFWKSVNLFLMKEYEQ